MGKQPFSQCVQAETNDSFSSARDFYMFEHLANLEAVGSSPTWSAIVFELFFSLSVSRAGLLSLIFLSIRQIHIPFSSAVQRTWPVHVGKITKAE